MSHFYTLVLIDPAMADDPESAVEPILAPYDENISTAPTREYMDASDIESMAKYYTDKGKDVSTSDLSTLVPFLKEWNGCDGGIDSKGNLYYLSTYNPQSQWDWYVVGGRWSGQLGGYDVRDYPQNYEVCHLCNGTGTRPDGIERFGEAWAESNGGCNGCSGEGTRLKWSDHFVPEDGNIKPVAALLPLLGDVEQADKIVPFAIVTPSEGWVERGSMGWFGMASDEKDSDDWANQVKTLLETYPEHVAVVVDCHI